MLWCLVVWLGGGGRSQERAQLTSWTREVVRGQTPVLSHTPDEAGTRVRVDVEAFELTLVGLAESGRKAQDTGASEHNRGQLELDVGHGWSTSGLYTGLAAV